MLSATISRTPSDLTIDNEVTEAGFWLDEVSRPAFDYRRTYASSPFTRAVQTSAVKDGGTLEVVLYAKAATSAALATLRAELEDAVGQFFFTLTVTEDGVATVYDCDCAAVSWNSHDAGMASAHIARAVLTIPCYPTGA